MTHINVDLPQTLHRKLKAKAALEGVTLEKAVEAAIQGYVGESQRRLD